jgi:pimeloyl-ACP methyl ester carboxylesterase
MPTADVNGIRIHYEVHGEGRPLLLILGLSSDLSEMGKPLIQMLGARSQVIGFDNRGAGRSDKPDAPYSIELMASDALGVMDAAGVTRAGVLGISLGGRIALELALGHPERVERLILVSTSARVVPGWRRRWRRHYYPFLSGLPVLRGKYPQPRYAFVRQMEASTGYDARPRLHQLGMPTLLLHGRNDRTAPLALAEELQRGIPGSRLQTFKGGHLFFLIRERRRFADVVAEYIGQA